MYNKFNIILLLNYSHLYPILSYKVMLCVAFV